MKRLTERLWNSQVGIAACGSNCEYEYKYCDDRAENCPAFKEIYEKLAIYEELEEEE